MDSNQKKMDEMVRAIGKIIDAARELADAEAEYLGCRDEQKHSGGVRLVCAEDRGEAHD